MCHETAPAEYLVSVCSNAAAESLTLSQAIPKTCCVWKNEIRGRKNVISRRYVYKRVDGGMGGDDIVLEILSGTELKPIRDSLLPETNIGRSEVPLGAVDWVSFLTHLNHGWQENR